MNDAGLSTRVYHDLESYDASSGTLITWVNIPSLSSSNDTVFYMYYGNPSCINQAYPKKTWDSHYQAVWHMNDATISTISDSTVNGYTGTKKAANEPMEENGKIGKAQDFDGSNDYVSIADDAAWALTSFTMETWVKFDTISSSWWEGCFMGQTEGVGSKNKFYFCYDVTDHYTLMHINTPANIDVLAHGDFWTASTGTWYHIVVTKSGSNYAFYKDGVAQGTYSNSNSIPNVAAVVKIGKGEGTAVTIDGIMDEVRISNIAGTDAWILTSYHTMNDPTNFLSIGPEEPSP